MMYLLLPAAAMAQVPVDDNGNAIGNYESQADIMPIGEDGIPRLSHTELQELVGPIALYPDDLLAIVLPASAYPLQVVEAARFLKALETDPTLKPDPDWDDSIIALLNYPEVVELLNKDLDWTWRLGEAVVGQQTDVISAVESFRDRAYAAGNLKSDEYQTIANNEGVISISPTAEDVIYIPYYEPERVVYYQPRPAYYYYPRPYPVYYYPYAANHYFDRGFFWGVTTAFSIGWYTDSLHVFHHSYHGHPYYGRTYWNDSRYRRPSINVYNTTYVSNTNVTVNRHSSGDQWRARDSRREYVRREGYARKSNHEQYRSSSREREYEPITFRERETRTVEAQRSVSRDTQRQHTVNRVRDSQRAESVTRSRNTQSETVTRTREQAPARATVRTPAPRQQTEARTRSQPSRTHESRSQPTRSQPTSSQPTRSQPTQSPPTRSQPTRSETTRSQPTRSQPTRSTETRSHSSNSNKSSAKRSSDRRGRNND
jgi:hypothetical protein